MSTIEELTLANSAAWKDLVAARAAAKGKPDESDEATAKKAATERHVTTKKALDDATNDMREKKAALKAAKDAEKEAAKAAKAEKEAAKAAKADEKGRSATPPRKEDSEKAEAPLAPRKGRKPAAGGAGGK